MLVGWVVVPAVPTCSFYNHVRRKAGPDGLADGLRLQLGWKCFPAVRVFVASLL
jgi:hypothetical protein